MLRDVSYFVEEECASVGLFELSHMVGMCIRERPLDMTEEFALEQGFRQCSCIHADHGFECALGHAVDLAGQNILSRSVLSGDEHSRVGRSDLLHRPPDIAHRLTLAPMHLQ